jgi:hypothetical protein
MLCPPTNRLNRLRPRILLSEESTKSTRDLNSLPDPDPTVTCRDGTYVHLPGYCHNWTFGERSTLAEHCVTGANCQKWSAYSNPPVSYVFIIHRTILLSHRSLVLFYPVEPYPVICRHLA